MPKGEAKVRASVGGGRASGWSSGGNLKNQLGGIRNWIEGAIVANLGLSCRRRLRQHPNALLVRPELEVLRCFYSCVLCVVADVFWERQGGESCSKPR
jgi:hypothetical protein